MMRLATFAVMSLLVCSISPLIVSMAGASEGVGTFFYTSRYFLNAPEAIGEVFKVSKKGVAQVVVSVKAGPCYQKILTDSQRKHPFRYTIIGIPASHIKSGDLLIYGFLDGRHMVRYLNNDERRRYRSCNWEN